MPQGRTNAELRDAVAAQLAAGKSIEEVKNSFAGQQLGGSVVREVANNRNIGPYSPPPPPPQDLPTSPPPSSSDPYSYDPLPPSTPVSNPAASQVPFSEVDLLGRATTSAATATITNAGLEAVERIRQAGETERLKYEVDNRIPVVQAEAKGRLDLQEIVNAGYKNIANIERGSSMVNSITSMFNF